MISQSREITNVNKVLGFAYKKDIKSRIYNICISDLKVKDLMKKINEIFTNTSYDWVNIKESINSYCYNFVFSLFFVKNAEKYILIDDYLLLKINYFLWKQWENIGCKNNSALLLGLDEKERKTVVNTKVIYWGKEHYDIVKNYLNKDYIKNEGVLFFNTTHQEAIKRHSVKAALKESFLL